MQLKGWGVLRCGLVVGSVGCAPWTPERLLEHTAEVECAYLRRCDDGSGWVAELSRSECVETRLEDLRSANDGVPAGPAECWEFNEVQASECARDLSAYWRRPCGMDPVGGAPDCPGVWTVTCVF